jgi:hypothetical protein
LVDYTEITYEKLTGSHGIRGHIMKSIQNVQNLFIQILNSEGDKLEVESGPNSITNLLESLWIVILSIKKVNSEI